MLISQSIPALFNGVSQQPAPIRLPSQGAAMANGYATVADGLRKRPPTRHVGQIAPSDLSAAFIHTINRDVTERYIVVVSDGGLAVYDDDGVAVTVNFPEGTTYLNVVGTATAAEAFALVTVADYTFVVNKTVAVLMAAVGADLALPAGWSSYYQPGTWYSVSASAPDTRYYNPSRTYLGVKQTFTDLPAAATNPAEGTMWKIKGADGAYGEFYVRRTGGVWEESAQVGISHKFNDNTMPWALVRESDGEFYFRPFKWNVRKFGDDESNPPPTFVGKTISDVFFYKNRLAFACDENVIFSAAGEFGNFWRSTVTDVLDSDVVDVAVSSNNVALIKFAVPFNNNLMLFADQTQFSLNVDQLLTPRTVSIDAVTNYEMNTRARPAAIGNDVYFAQESGAYSRIREYFTEEGNTTITANDVTAHVPKYVPSGIFKLAGNSNQDVLFAISDAVGFRNRVYVYKFHWDDTGKVQSSWGYWVHGDEDTIILSIEALEDELYITTYRAGDGVYLEKCNVQSGQTTGALPFEVLLDRGAEVTGVYAEIADETTFTLPYDVAVGARANFQIVLGADFATPGALVDPTSYTWLSANSLKVDGDLSDGEVHVGHSYEFRYRFSEVFVRRGDAAITTGRFQLRTWVLYFTETGFFQTSVSPYGVDALVESIVPASLAEYSGKTLGAASLILGEPNFASGTYSFQVYGNSRDAVVELVNDTHVQSTFQSAEYEGLYHNRASAR